MSLDPKSKNFPGFWRELERLSAVIRLYRCMIRDTDICHAMSSMEDCLEGRFGLAIKVVGDS
jgi:hypothetical protein